MTFEEIMLKLEELGSEQTKKTFTNHGAKEPFFGVKVGDLKKLVKYVKNDHELAIKLYETGNHDAMYLAGLSVNPKLVSKETLYDWAEKAYWYMLAEYTVAGVAAESSYAVELAREWMNSEEEMTAVCGWSTYANYVTITQDDQLDLDEIRSLLKTVATTIHDQPNRVRYTMNTFVICTGGYVGPIRDEAFKTAEAIGKVHVDMGKTACKVPLAIDYIEKMEQRGNAGVKKKTCIC